MCLTCIEYQEYCCLNCGQSGWSSWNLPDEDEDGLIDCPTCGKHTVEAEYSPCSGSTPERRMETAQKRLAQIVTIGKSVAILKGVDDPCTVWYREEYLRWKAMVK